MRKSDRRSLLLLFVAVVGVWSGVLLDRLWLQGKEGIVTIDELKVDSLTRTSEVIYQRKEAVYAGDDAEEADDKVETFAFDPNTADSTTFLRLGLARWQVRSIYRYRAKGGRYHRPEDFQRVPGMTPEVWERLARVMVIGEAFRYYHDGGDAGDGPRGEGRGTVGEVDSLPYGYQEKYREVVELDLNTVDSAALKMIPGIASVRARRILRYREDLGGFVSLDQLKEIDGLPEGIEQWFKVETGVFRRMEINMMTAASMSHHPYITYAQARAIVDYRRTYGAIKSLGDLRLLNEFTEADIRRLEPYVSY